jgi:hypothetical protein
MPTAPAPSSWCERPRHDPACGDGQHHERGDEGTPVTRIAAATVTAVNGQERIQSADRDA